MDSLRLATAEEIKAIQEGSDLTPQSTVIAFDRQGGKADIAVVKQVTELDPVWFQPESDTRRRALFVWAIENALRLMGTPGYYFNVAAADTTWQRAVEGWGARRVSTQEEFRYNKQLQTSSRSSSTQTSGAQVAPKEA